MNEDVNTFWTTNTQDSDCRTGRRDDKITECFKVS